MGNVRAQPAPGLRPQRRREPGSACKEISHALQRKRGFAGFGRAPSATACTITPSLPMPATRVRKKPHTGSRGLPSMKIGDSWVARQGND